MEVPVVAELAWALTRAGHPTLRLDYPGVGASGGRFDLEAALEASARGLEHLEACLGDEGGSLAGLAGVGLGAALATRLATARPDTDRVLVQPDRAALLEGPPASALAGSVVVIAAGEDTDEDRSAWRSWVAEARSGRLMVVPNADRAWRRHLVVVGQAAAELFSPPGMVDLEP
jgi:alpha/beta superfamily hydrolase